MRLPLLVLAGLLAGCDTALDADAYDVFIQHDAQPGAREEGFTVAELRFNMPGVGERLEGTFRVSAARPLEAIGQQGVIRVRRYAEFVEISSRDGLTRGHLRGVLDGDRIEGEVLVSNVIGNQPAGTFRATRR